MSEPDPGMIADARADAAAAIRRLGHAFIGHAAELDTIRGIATQLDALTTELEAAPRRDRTRDRPTGEWESPPEHGGVMTSHDERPISGRSSPWGLDLTIHRDGDEAVGTLTLGPAHEGAPARSHGGIVAALFDDVYGFVLTIHRTPAFTGELTVRYRAGTPIGQPLECRVRRTGQDGRKISMTGELTAGDDVVATSTATFIAVDPSIFGAAAATA